jgi:hypothetical protein
MNDYDTPWKEVLEAWFPEFLAFFFPDARAAIDWTRGYSFLDKELEKVVRDAELGKRLADKLVQVWRKDGTPGLVLVHIEIQGNPDPAMEERMYVYSYRIYDRYRHPVASLIVLADDDPDWRPEYFGYDLFGCRVRLWFPGVKLLDYRDRWSMLETSENPFGTVVRAYLKARETAKDPSERLAWKWRLTRELYLRGLDRTTVLNLFRFIDWILQLPAELEQDLKERIERFEAERKMPYVTSIERLGMEKGHREGLQRGLEQGLEQGLQRGHREGRQEGARAVLQRILIHRFGPLPDWATARLTEAELNELELWSEAALNAASLEEVFQPGSH